MTVHSITIARTKLNSNYLKIVLAPRHKLAIVAGSRVLEMSNPKMERTYVRRKQIVIIRPVGGADTKSGETKPKTKDVEK